MDYIPNYKHLVIEKKGKKKILPLFILRIEQVQIDITCGFKSVSFPFLYL